VSDVGFAKLWGRNPARPYFATLTAELHRAGPAANLWDTRLPPNITTALVADSRVSPVLRLARIPFALQAPGSEPQMVDPTGRLRPATFVAWSQAPSTGCDLILRGATSVTLPLRTTFDQQLVEGKWFARIGYLTDHETRLQVELIDVAGRVVPMPEPAAAWPAGLATMYYGPAATIRATSVRLRTTDPATNLCLSTVDIGLPKVKE
jgi:hypothetical protein